MAKKKKPALQCDAMLEDARRYREMGYGVIPLQPGGKIPVVPWKEFQTRLATQDELNLWFSGTRKNIAIVTGEISGGLFVKDFDLRTKAEEHFKRYRGLIRTIVETPRPGWHFYYRKPGARNTQGDKEDERGDGGTITAPPSLVSNKQYRFVEGHGLVHPEELCEFPDAVVSTTERRIAGKISDVRAYIRAIYSIQGQRGSDACFRVACVLRDAGFSEAETLEELIGWNESNASPAWSLRELTHKSKSAFERKAK